jgi:hypothetical protein
MNEELLTPPLNQSMRGAVCGLFLAAKYQNLPSFVFQLELEKKKLT